MTEINNFLVFIMILCRVSVTFSAETSGHSFYTLSAISWTFARTERSLKLNFNLLLKLMYFPYGLIFSEQKIDGKALIFLSKEGSFAQLDVCGLNTVGDQMRLKELVAGVPVVDTHAGRRNSKPSVMTIKQSSDLNQRIYKAK